MASRRERGMGRIYQRGERWYGKLDITNEVGYTDDGKRRYKYFSGKTESEVKRKIRDYHKEGQHKTAFALVFVDPHHLQKTE